MYTVHDTQHLEWEESVDDTEWTHSQCESWLEEVNRFMTSSTPSTVVWNPVPTACSPPPTTNQTTYTTDPVNRAAYAAAAAEASYRYSQSLNSSVHSPTSPWSTQSDGSHQRPFDESVASDNPGERLYLDAMEFPPPQRRPLPHHHSMDGAVMQSQLFTATTPTVMPNRPPLAVPWPDLFSSTRGPYHDPPFEDCGDAQPQRKAKRSADDLYTPQWIRNRGTQREGWCGWCSAWFTLRDSTYWYHLHYVHGISQANGKRLPAPAGFRTFCDSAEWEVKCGKCGKWMPLATGERFNAAYFRHTYKCYFKSVVKAKKSEAASPDTSIASPSKARRST